MEEQLERDIPPTEQTTMAMTEFEERGKKWIEQNREYDTVIQKIIDSKGAVQLSAEEMAHAERLQNDLWDGEKTLLNIASGKTQLIE